MIRAALLALCVATAAQAAPEVLNIDAPPATAAVTLADIVRHAALSDDRLTWTLTLRDTPVRPEDVARSLADAAAGDMLDLDMMLRAEPSGPDTLRITLRQPWLTFDDMFRDLPVAGPANPAFPRIAFTRHDPHVILGPSPPRAGFRTVTLPPDTTLGISLPFLPRDGVDGMPMGNAVTVDPAMRKAINLGLDRAALAAFGTPAFGPADTRPWGGTGGDFDPDAARATLDAAGWIPGPHGIRERGGVRAAFRILYPTGLGPVAERAADLLRPLGIEAFAKEADPATIAHLQHSEPVLFAIPDSSPEQIHVLFSGRLGGFGQMNPTFYANAKVELLLADAQAQHTREDAYPLWRSAADISGMGGDNAWAWLLRPARTYQIDDCIEGDPPLANLPDWRWRC